MTIKEKIGKALVVASLTGMLGGFGGVLHYTTERTEPVKQYFELKRELDRAVAPDEIIENPQIRENYMALREELDNLKSNPEIDKYRQAQRNKEYSLLASVLPTIPLSIGIGMRYGRRKREEEEKENDESGFIEPSL